MRNPPRDWERLKSPFILTDHDAGLDDRGQKRRIHRRLDTDLLDPFTAVRWLSAEKARRSVSTSVDGKAAGSAVSGLRRVQGKGSDGEKLLYYITERS